MTDLEKELTEVLQIAYEHLSARIEAGAEEVARIQKMSPSNTQDLIETWKRESPILNRINTTLSKIHTLAMRKGR